VTPTQLRAYSAVVRLGSVKDAAAELGVTEAAVSMHVGQLRKQLEDQLFVRTPSGLSFTPGGLRLARRAVELLGLQDRTIREVSQAAKGRRLLRVAASGLFAEYAAPGLIELFTGRSRNLDFELSVRRPRDFPALLASRTADVAIGPCPPGLPPSVEHAAFLNYTVVLVAAPDHELARYAWAAPPSARPAALDGVITRPAVATAPPTPVPLAALQEQTWLMGPTAVGPDGTQAGLLRRFAVAESQQRIFQNNAAAVEEAKRGSGVAFAVSFAVDADLASGRLVRLPLPSGTADGAWHTMTLSAASLPPAAAEFIRFVRTPRAIQAMLRGAGVAAGHFRRAVHVTLWS
jgi:LysR family transcriptional regulator, low CO2-responsive transcriptional regulator